MRLGRMLAALSVVAVSWAAMSLAQPSGPQKFPETRVLSGSVAPTGVIDPLSSEFRAGGQLVITPGGLAQIVPAVEVGTPAGPGTPATNPVVANQAPPTTSASVATTAATTATTRGTTRTTAPPTQTTVLAAPATTSPVTTAAVPTTAAPTTTAPPAVAPNGAIVVNPGMNLGSLVSSNPAGTAFLIKAGTHVGQSVSPKDGNQFIGERGAILDGNGAKYAFAGTAVGVVIQGLIIEDYNNGFQHGAIHGSGSNWLVKNNEIRYNHTVGVVVPPGTLVVGNYIHHNSQMGLKAGGANVVIDGNEIAFNNHLDAFDMNNEAGGTKFLETRNMIVRNNYVHDNHGAGLWTDFDNYGTLYEGNVVINNYGPGIFHEISGSAVIRNNRVEGNGHRWYLGGILVANSSGVEVANNTLSGNNGGVMGLNQSRDAWVTKNLWVHNNSVSYTTGQSGIFAQANEDVIYSSWGNRFDGNNYALGSNPRPFRWAGDKTWDEWRAAGMDASGSRS